MVWELRTKKICLLRNGLKKFWRAISYSLWIPHKVCSPAPSIDYRIPVLFLKTEIPGSWISLSAPECVLSSDPICVRFYFFQILQLSQYYQEFHYAKNKWFIWNYEKYVNVLRSRQSGSTLFTISKMMFLFSNKFHKFQSEIFK